VNDDLRRISKEAIMYNLRQYPGTYLEGLRKTTKKSVRIADPRDEI
jgi:hypothetical protein